MSTYRVSRPTEDADELFRTEAAAKARVEALRLANVTAVWWFDAEGWGPWAGVA